jgi:hypothetical protein
MLLNLEGDIYLLQPGLGYLQTCKKMAREKRLEYESNARPRPFLGSFEK